jgi:hypothetical protein
MPCILAFRGFLHDAIYGKVFRHLAFYLYSSAYYRMDIEGIRPDLGANDCPTSNSDINKAYTIASKPQKFFVV